MQSRIRAAPAHQGLERARLLQLAFVSGTESVLARRSVVCRSVGASVAKTPNRARVGARAQTLEVPAFWAVGQVPSVSPKFRESPKNDIEAILGRHLIQNRAGWQFGRALATLRRRGRRPTRGEIADYLAQKYGIEEWRDLNNISSLHNFLSWCGAVRNYELVPDVFRDLLGATADEVGEFERLPQQSRLCLEALVRLGGTATAREIRTAAEAYSGRPMSVHNMPALMQPIVDQGLAVLRRPARQQDCAIFIGRCASCGGAGAYIREPHR